MGRVQGKDAFIPGAARGQGRSHAVRLAEEGADIIVVDRCHDFATVNYPMATSDDLKETARLVAQLDRRIVAVEADVRDRSALTAALERGLAELGKVDIVVAGRNRPHEGPATHAGHADPLRRPGGHQEHGAVPGVGRVRYVTGMQMRVDAGGYLKWYDFHL